MTGGKAVAGRLTSAGRWLAGWFWQALAILAVLSLALMSYKPFSEPRDPDAEDVAAAWNASIQRLGILALYPPAEDFYVGDLWAVIVSDDDGSGKPETHLSTLVGKSARVTHIDLRRELLAESQRQPVFLETIEKEQHASYRKSDPVEADHPFPAGRIVTSLTAFPGITITHRTRGTAALDRGILGFGAGRDDQRVEEIRIPVAETYGVAASPAVIRLDQWCKNPTTAIYCKDEFVRRLIAFSTDNRILGVENGKYRTRIQLRLVTRVFLTREIQHRRSVVDGSAVGGQAGAIRPLERPAKDDAATGSLDQRVNDAPKAVAPDASAPAGGAGAAVSFTRADGTDIGLNEVFQRPVVFGYRAISIDLEPSSPPKGESP